GVGRGKRAHGGDLVGGRRLDLAAQDELVALGALGQLLRAYVIPAGLGGRVGVRGVVLVADGVHVGRERGVVEIGVGEREIGREQVAQRVGRDRARAGVIEVVVGEHTGAVDNRPAEVVDLGVAVAEHLVTGEPLGGQAGEVGMVGRAGAAE